MTYPTWAIPGNEDEKIVLDDEYTHPFDPSEKTWCCGVAIGEHRQGGDCPSEIDLLRRYGYM